MAWFRIQLSEDERRILNEERTSHPSLHVRGKMLTIWLLHCEVTREKAVEIVGVSPATVQRYVEAYRTGGLDGLRRSGIPRPVSELAAFRDIIRASFEEQPVRTIAEACDRVEKLTGIRRSPPGPHLSQRPEIEVAAHPRNPGAAKRTWPSTFRTKLSFSTTS